MKCRIWILWMAGDFNFMITFLFKSLKNPQHSWLLCLDLSHWPNSGASNPPPMGHMRLSIRTAVDETQHQIANLLKTWWDFFVWLCITVYLMCGPRQLVFFLQCGPEMPKGWTPLVDVELHSSPQSPLPIPSAPCSIGGSLEAGRGKSIWFTSEGG